MKSSRSTNARKNKPGRLIHPDELSRLANVPAKEDKSRTSHTTQTIFFSGDNDVTAPPKLQVSTIKGPKEKVLLRVEVRGPAGFSTHLPGISTGPAKLRSQRAKTADKAKAALDGYRPTFRGINFLPSCQKPIIPRRRAVFREFGGVFPPDDRFVLTDTSWPWLTIGRVLTSDGTGGSAALVGDRLILTARHLRPIISIGKGSWWIKFIPHYYDGTEPFGSSYVSDTRFYPGTLDTDPQHDYMICRLYDPLGTSLGFFGSQEYVENWNGLAVWASVGYPSDFQSGLRPAVQVPATIEGRNTAGGGQALETEADLWYGASGGPFWAWFDVGGGNLTPRIVGVVMGEYDVTSGDDDNSLSGGADMVHLIDWGRANWP